MAYYMRTECCNVIKEVDLTNNGVLLCAHYVCCGWGHGPFDPSEVVFGRDKEVGESRIKELESQ